MDDKIKRAVSNAVLILFDVPSDDFVEFYSSKLTQFPPSFINVSTSWPTDHVFKSFLELGSRKILVRCLPVLDPL